MALDEPILDYAHLPFAKEESPCGYFPENKCSQAFTITDWYKDPAFSSQGKDFPITDYYNFLKKNGFCRYHSVLYRYECEGCNQCCPIRINVEKFTPSKSQRAAWNKNQDIEVILQTNPEDFVSEERALLFREYDAYHNQDQAGFERKSIPQALNDLKDMNSGYEGIWNLEYRLNGRLIGVGILDYTTDSSGKIAAVCSNYFYYDTSNEYASRSLGVFSVLKELELCKKKNISFYYLGLFLPGIRKMNYKINFEPYELFIDGSWISSDFVMPEPGELYEDFPEVCFVTKELDLPLLVAAYKQGVFPWFCEEAGEPVVWQSTNPRFVIPIEKLHIPKTLKKFLKHTPYTYTMDTCFDEVMRQCSKMERKGQDGTWIGPKMLRAYSKLHKLGYAHSIEVWNGEKLAGGFYGILLGSVFCGESMFTIEPNSSSSAFVLFAQAFAACGGKVIDCQAYTDNMARYGAIEMPRTEYLKLLKKYQRVRLLKELRYQLEECQKNK